MAQCSQCGEEAGDARFCPACGATVARGPKADPMVGRTIAGKYRVDALLGEGGMGMVYRANQVALDKTIVLKVLRPSLMSDERTVARFQREAKAASRLNHPNSIQVIDFGQAADDRSMYIAMEYCPGADLHHVISNEWPLDEGRTVRIVSQVLSALADAHAAGVIHRDLKPENIMVEQRRGETDFVKVLDFGIAKITDSTGEEGQQALTRAGFVCGTPEYMSPEQAKGATIDHRSDLYAVGVILYQMVTGLLPFDSESAVGFATAHLTQEVPSFRARRSDARSSAQLERLVMRALAKDPDERPQTAEEFIQLLQNVLVGRSSNPSLRSLQPGSNRTGQHSAPKIKAAPSAALPNSRVDEATAINSSPGGRWDDKTPSAASDHDESTHAIGKSAAARIPRRAVTEPNPERRDWRIPAGVALVVALCIGGWAWWSRTQGGGLNPLVDIEPGETAPKGPDIAPTPIGTRPATSAGVASTPSRNPACGRALPPSKTDRDRASELVKEAKAAIGEKPGANQTMAERTNAILYKLRTAYEYDPSNGEMYGLLFQLCRADWSLDDLRFWVEQVRSSTAPKDTVAKYESLVLQLGNKQ